MDETRVGKAPKNFCLSDPGEVVYQTATSDRSIVIRVDERLLATVDLA